MTAVPLTANELRRRIDEPGSMIPVDVHTTGLLADEIRRITTARGELAAALRAANDAATQGHMNECWRIIKVACARLERATEEPTSDPR